MPTVLATWLVMQRLSFLDSDKENELNKKVTRLILNRLEAICTAKATKTCLMNSYSPNESILIIFNAKPC